MDRALWRIMASMALIFICSCAAKAYTRENRNYCTGIKPDEGVVIALDTFRSHRKSIESEKEEESIENCVSKGMIKTNQWLKIVSARDFRRTVFPNKEFEDSPRSSKVLLSFLSDPSTRNRLTELGVRYIIIVRVTTSEREKSWETRSSGGMCAVGKARSKYYDMIADIVDVKYLRESGSVNAWATGEAAWGFFCGCATSPASCLPVPPLPYYYAERTEAEVCPALGEGVMKFIIDGHDMVPAPELGPGIDSGAASPDTQTEPRPGSAEDLLKGLEEPRRYDKDSQN